MHLLAFKSCLLPSSALLKTLRIDFLAMPNSFGVSILGGSVRRKDSRQNNCNIPKLLDMSVQEIMVPIALL